MIERMRSSVRLAALLVPTALVFKIDSVQADPEPVYGSQVRGVRIGLSLSPEQPVFPSDLSLQVTLHNTTSQTKTIPASLCGQITWQSYTNIAVRIDGGKTYRVPIHGMIDITSVHDHEPLILQPNQKLEAKVSFSDLAQHYPLPDSEQPLSSRLTKVSHIELWAELSIEGSPTVRSGSIQRRFGLKHIQKPLGEQCLTQLVAGYYHACVLNRVGTPYCWGETEPGYNPETKRNEVSYPRALHWLPQGTSHIGVGNTELCAITTDRDVLCLRGDNDGSSSRRLMSPQRIGGFPSGLNRLFMGAADLCAQTESGALWCWGRALLTVPPGGLLTEWRAKELSALGQDVVEVAMGAAHACARKRSGEVMCWGDNKVGQLGNGSTDNTETPKAVVGIGGEAKKLVAGNNFSCVLRADGKVFCWGKDEYGSLGKNIATPQRTATERSDLSGDGVDLFAAHNQLCLLRKDGLLQCMGVGLFSASMVSSQTPITMDGVPSDVVDVTIGDHDACARTRSGALWCWGETLRALAMPNEKKPPGGAQPVAGLSGVESVKIGYGFLCATTKTGGVFCWGDGSGGQLGAGGVTMSAKPLRLSIPCDK